MTSYEELQLRLDSSDQAKLLDYFCPPHVVESDSEDTEEMNIFPTSPTKVDNVYRNIITITIIMVCLLCVGVLQSSIISP